MPIQTRVSGAWKTATPSVRVGGAWKTAGAFVRVGGVWKSSAALQQVATPTVANVNFPGAPGDMTAYVTVACATAGATIYTSVNNAGWTTNTTPTVPPGQNLRAYATKAGMIDSAIMGPTTFY